MLNLLIDIKGIFVEDILFLVSEERDIEFIENGVGVFFFQFEILKCEIFCVFIFIVYNENCFFGFIIMIIVFVYVVKRYFWNDNMLV